MKTSLIILKILTVLFALLFIAFVYGYWITSYWAFIAFAGVSVFSLALAVISIIETKDVMKEEAIYD